MEAPLSPPASSRPSQSTVCEKIMELLGQNEVEQRQRQVVILSQDRFYKALSAEQKAKALKGQYNFDHPGELCCGVRGGFWGGSGAFGGRGCVVSAAPPPPPCP